MRLKAAQLFRGCASSVVLIRNLLSRPRVVARNGIGLMAPNP